ncbi:MAG: hypothetical protein LH461_09635, partial [Spirochaetaceae bacterium]|nr:hypothetical protein [Spirochaetaceae bacterium]
MSTTLDDPPVPPDFEEPAPPWPELPELDDLEWRARDALLVEMDESWPPPGMVGATAAGPVLAALLNTVCLPEVGDEVLVEVAAGAHRQRAWTEARGLAATLELTRRVTGWRGVGPGADEVVPEQMAAAEL